ncbi:histidine phosphatase family protein [Secundilactobacillus similis]|uniref:Phosphoglycerate mutase n=1 Tax=Secundilactobacillus similis DSM 23365 = JCM 2765 TaxID=1423804 RepID=A0A0R2FGD7_9LACO|nr:histidine phosphatase family protein [Secundilactobacillus similis]KRN26619.1 hypothetical protein FD14_GL000838 [Secundilactobacillus similis DSM 23365 = JCM 2765]
MTTFNIYLVRHGQTYLNKYHRLQGWIDAPLTETGLADIAHAGDRLSKITFDQAYTSDLPRARQTAEAILARNPSPLTEAIPNAAFREENFGYYEGNDDVATWHLVGGPEAHNTFNDLISTYSIETIKDMLHDLDPTGDAETNAQFWARLQPGFDTVIANANDGDNVLITSHGTTIRSIVSRFAPDIDIAVSALNGAVTKLTVTDGQISVDYYNNADQEL